MDNNSRLFVGNLSYQTQERDLQDHFSAAGVVTNVNLMLDRVTGKSRGFAFVEFSTPDEANRAVEMFHGKDLGGRALTVNIARPREERPATAATEAAAATTTGGALFTGTGNVDGQRTTTQIFAVEHFHSTIGFVCRRELDEGETTRLSSHAIEHQVDISDHTGRRKVILEVTFLRLVGQVSHKQTGIVIHMTFGRSSTE